MPIFIHNKDYITVAERVQQLHADETVKGKSIQTEVISSSPAIVIKATVIIDGNTFTGISAANPTKAIEKMSPYEVAETSAVGRALGFAGYGITESVATADEMYKALEAEKIAYTGVTTDVTEAFDQSSPDMPDVTPTNLGVCPKCKGEMVFNPKTSKIFCKAKCWLNK